METITLYRPIGQKELDLIKEANYQAFPKRLAWQPIFYPVLDYEYACTIAKEWNTNDNANGNVGYVSQFEISIDHFKKYTIQNVGLKNHNEIWVPAEELALFNSQIINGIKIIKAFYGEKFIGETEYE
jgi:hypothetical protein